MEISNYRKLKQILNFQEIILFLSRRFFIFGLQNKVKFMVTSFNQHQQTISTKIIFNTDFVSIQCCKGNLESY